MVGWGWSIRPRSAFSRTPSHPRPSPSRGGASPSRGSLFIEAGQPLRFILGGQSADQLVQLAFEDLGEAVEGEVDAVVGHPPLREIIGTDALGAVARSDHRLAHPGPLRGEPLALQLVKAG